MLPNSTNLPRSRPTCTATSRLRKAPDTNLSDAMRKTPTDRPRAGRSMSDRSIELGRRSIPLISQRQRSASFRLGTPTTASLETTATTTAHTKSRSVNARTSPPDIFDRWRSRPVTNKTKQHSEVRASKEPVKTKSKVTFSSSAKKIDGGSRVRRRRSGNNSSPSSFKGDRRRHARHRKCEIEGLSLLQSLSICDQDHPTGIDNTNAEAASDSMRTLVSMSSYDRPISLEVIWSPCA